MSCDGSMLDLICDMLNDAGGAGTLSKEDVEKAIAHLSEAGFIEVTGMEADGSLVYSATDKGRRVVGMMAEVADAVDGSVIEDPHPRYEGTSGCVAGVHGQELCP